jgi:polysaccharide pyruvyl transferase CsaB
VPEVPGGPRIVVSGYYGFGNIGDEALLAGLLTGMREAAPEVSPVVLSADPTATTAVHGVEAVNRSSLSLVWRALHNSQGLLSGGGSLLQDVTSRRSIYYYLSVMALAQLLRRPYCLYGQGIGPIGRPAAQWATRLVLQGSRGVWVRDRASLTLVRELGARPVQLSVVGDPAFLLPPVSSGEADALGPADGQRPVWVIAVRPWGDEAGWLPNLVTALGKAATEAEASLVFLPMHQRTDAILSEKMAQQIRNVYGVPVDVAEACSFHGARQLLACADMVLAMRLHALMLAVASVVPSVAISYDPKVEAFASEVGLPWIALGALKASSGACQLRQMIVAAWRASQEVTCQLKRHAGEQRKAASQGLVAALGALGVIPDRPKERAGQSGTRCDRT